MKYRKKPVLVDAVQFTGWNCAEIRAWIWEHQVPTPVRSTHAHSASSATRIEIQAPRRRRRGLAAAPSDWFVRDADGTFSVYTSATFEAAFEVVPPSALPWIGSHQTRKGDP